MSDRTKDYVEVIRPLLPPRAYDPQGEYLAGDVQITAQAAAVIHADAEALIDSALPPLVAGKLQVPEDDLTDWERRYNLPSTGGYELRCSRILAAIRKKLGIKPADIAAALEPLLGYRPEVIEQTLFRCDNPNSLTDNHPLVEPDEEVYRGRVIIDPALAPNSFTRSDVKRIIEDTQPGGTLFEPQFLGFYCDDEFSLTDNDLLAV